LLHQCMQLLAVAMPYLHGMHRQEKIPQCMAAVLSVSAIRPLQSCRRQSPSPPSCGCRSHEASPHEGQLAFASCHSDAILGAIQPRITWFPCRAEGTIVASAWGLPARSPLSTRNECSIIPCFLQSNGH
jgi:hypothetical protein